MWRERWESGLSPDLLHGLVCHLLHGLVIRKDAVRHLYGSVIRTDAGVNQPGICEISVNLRQSAVQTQA